MRFQGSRPNLHVDAVNPSAHQQTFFQHFLTDRAIWIEPHPAATCARLNCNLDFVFGFNHGQLPFRADSTLYFPLGYYAEDSAPYGGARQ